MTRNRRSKRERPQTTTDLPSSLSKRPRFHPPPPPTTYRVEDEDEESPSSSSSSSSVVMVVGLPSDCTVMELKSRMEMYGPISRTRVDATTSSAIVSFRSVPSADAAITASVDPTSGISIGSKKVIVCRAADPQLVWKSETGVSAPFLNQHGRSNDKQTAVGSSTKTASELPYKGREIVAYDDLF